MHRLSTTFHSGQSTIRHRTVVIVGAEDRVILRIRGFPGEKIKNTTETHMPDAQGKNPLPLAGCPAKDHHAALPNKRSAMEHRYSIFCRVWVGGWLVG